MGPVCSKKSPAIEAKMMTAQLRRKQETPVTLHVYDIGDSGRGEKLNWFLGQLGTGAFHCGVEVFDWEWSYSDVAGVDTRQTTTTGIFCTRPRRCEGHSYSRSLDMGTTSLSEVEVLRLISLLERQWVVIAYDVLKNNCCHFCDEFCMRLGVGGLPPWVLNLASAGEALLRGTSELTNTRCCRMIAGGTQDAILDENGAPRGCCKKVQDPEEANGDSAVHYLM